MALNTSLDRTENGCIPMIMNLRMAKSISSFLPLDRGLWDATQRSSVDLSDFVSSHSCVSFWEGCIAKCPSSPPVEFPCTSKVAPYVMQVTVFREESQPPFEQRFRPPSHDISEWH
jgi:hypothetical protein